MTTYPLPTLACTVSLTGISKPTFSDVLASLQAIYQSIYGSDVNLDPDTQDGQLLSAFASAINDSNNATVAAYNAFSPATAQGVGLSSVVKINGLQRNIPSRSTVDVAIVGVTGTQIRNGIVSDGFGQRWLLPHGVVLIPLGGTITVTATAELEGDLQAPAGSVTDIATPTRGWQTVTNPADAIPGAPVEIDADLRRRQSISTSKPSQTITTGILAEVANLPGIQRAQIYENTTGSPDTDGIPGHSIAVVVAGGDLQEIADAIALKKPPGCGTFGATTETVIDPGGVSIDINFDIMAPVPIVVEIDLTAAAGYASTTGDEISARIAAYITGLQIGQDVLLSKIFAPADLNDEILTNTYDITEIRLARDGDPPAVGNIVIDYNEGATCVVADILIIVT